MLLWFVIAYWIISVGIGLYAATRVHNTKDFAIAGRHLPFYMVTTPCSPSLRKMAGMPSTVSEPNQVANTVAVTI